jgi:Methyltransferase domain
MSTGGQSGGQHDRIGRGHMGARRTEPRIARLIWDALGDARTVLHVGAGTGSYEPPDREVLAVESSEVMRAERPETAAPCIAAQAESLPFADGSFDAAMAILSDHDWSDPIAGLREMARVARRIVVFQWDNSNPAVFWLVRDYLPEAALLAAGTIGLADRARALGASTTAVPIPWDCVDGFFHAYWRRPDAYLDDRVRRGMSVWDLVGPDAEARAVRQLYEDLASGAWTSRNRDLLALEEIDLGARLLVAN